MLPLELTKNELDFEMTSYDIKRLEMYSNNLVDYHLIMDLVPTLGKFYFLNLMKDTSLSAVQSVRAHAHPPTHIRKSYTWIFLITVYFLLQTILLGVGLQRKTVDEIAAELNLNSSQILGIFNKIIRKSVEFLNSILEGSIEIKKQKQVVTMMPTLETVEEDLEKAAKVLPTLSR